MRIACPECRFSADVDPARIPPQSRACCPRCGTRFSVSAAVADTVKIPIPSENSVIFGVGRAEIFLWSRDGYLAPSDLPKAADLAKFRPDAAAWRSFLDVLTLMCGTAFLSLAVIFFFAYNWQTLGRTGRFALVEIPLIAAVLAAWRLGLTRHSGRAALTGAFLLVGALLALVGQTYQTGADPWELFAVWALLTLPWVLIGRFAPLWLLWLALINLSVGFYYQVTAGRVLVGLIGLFFSPEGIFWSLTLLNTLALVLWEVATPRCDWLVGRWAPRIILTLAAAAATGLALWGIFADNGNESLNLFAWSIGMFAGYRIYRRRSFDLYALALGVLSLIVVTSALLGKLLFEHGEASAFFLIGNAVIGLSALGGWWLHRVAREDA